MESRLKAALRIVRKLADVLAILALILLAILSIGFVGNAYPSLPDSDLDLYLEFVQCVLWILVPAAAARLAFETRRRAGYVCFAAVLMAFYFPPDLPYLSRWDEPQFLPHIIEIVFFALGMYWVLTSTFGCPPILAQPRQSTWRRKSALTTVGVAVFGLGILLMALIAVLPPNLDDRAEYMLPPPSPSPAGPNQAAFVATDVVGVNWEPSPKVWPEQLLGWLTLSQVREHFWGLPWWSRRYVLLMRPPEWRGEAYFYPGLRPEGIFARFLPVVTFFMFCSRMNLVRDAELDLRVLRDRPSPTKVCILGRVTCWAWKDHRPNVAGIKVTITGPSGSLELTTNENGFYYAPRLTPGRYAVQFDAPKAMLRVWRPCDEMHLRPGEIVQCDAGLVSVSAKQAP